MPTDRPMRAIFAVDPGGHTGIAWGTFNVTERNVGDALANRVLAGSTTLEGDERQQVIDLAELWHDFFRTAVKKQGLAPNAVELVFEDFTLRPGSHGGGKEGTSPERISWGFIGYRLGAEAEWRRSHRRTPAYSPQIIWQQPGDSSAFSAVGRKKQYRLKDWDVWVVGREHERSAWSHIALRIAKIQKANERQ